MSGSITVRFDLDESNWIKVIDEADEETENPTVIDERSNHFVVEYPSQQHFDAAHLRWEGMIQYTVV
jgi:hypothetical protein